MLDPQMKAPVYSRRLGKYASGKLCLVLITMNNSDEIKLILRSLNNFKSSARFNKIIVIHDLTILQRSQLKDLKMKCDKLNSEKKDPTISPF